MITAFGDIIDIRVEYEGVVYPVSLSHYPMVSWNHKSRGGFMIHGHTHGNIDKYNEESPDLRIDVGMDSAISKENGSFLIPFSKIMEVMEKKAKGREFMRYVQEVRHNL
jgi:calcineurin-like phosphoesterase family protein